MMHELRPGRLLLTSPQPFKSEPRYAVLLLRVYVIRPEPIHEIALSIFEMKIEASGMIVGECPAPD